jgi:predicted Zn-dependent protease
MLKELWLFLGLKKHHWLYSLLSLTVASTIVIADVGTTHAIPWSEILLRGVEVIQLSTISDRQEVRLGQQINQELINSGRVRLYNDRRLNGYLNQIGQRLVQVSDRPGIPYQFFLVDDDEANAFATMGGFVYVHTGLMKLADNEAELASVIAHEIGHIAAGHALNQMRDQALTQGLLTATGLDEQQVVQLGVTLALDLPHSRGDEYEADRLGLAMLTRAGYAPGAMVDFMQKLQGQTGYVPSFLSTHPAAQERVQALAREIPRQSAYVGDGLDNQAYRQRTRSLF